MDVASTVNRSINAKNVVLDFANTAVQKADVRNAILIQNIIAPPVDYLL
jgi:hypothetical protein